MIPMETIGFDIMAFDQMLRSHGVVLVHFRAIKCPIGVDDRFDVRSHKEHDNCSNGFIYKEAGEVTAFFSGNSSNSFLEDAGVMDGSTVQVTLPRYYDGSDVEIAVQHYDRFYLKEVAAASVNTQLIEAHVTGRDRLQYPAVMVEDVCDKHGTWYSASDFSIQGGQIVWGPKRPPFDAVLGKGTTYTIRYRYTPFWYVKNIIHEVRVSRMFDYKKNKQVLVRMPHAIQLQREYVFENEDRVRNAPGSAGSGGGTPDARDVKSPRSGSFGPR